MALMDLPLFFGELIFAIAVGYYIIKVFGPEYILSFIFPKQHINKNFVLTYPKIYPPIEDLDPSLVTPKEIESASSILTTTNSESVVKASYKINTWLENISSHSVQNWIKNQKYCFESLISSDKYIHKTSIVAQKYQRHFGNGIKIVYAPYQRGKFYFYYKKEKQPGGGIIVDMQPSLYYAKDIRQEGRLVLDIKGLLSNYGMILRGTWISDDGYKLAYGISEWYKKTYFYPDMYMTIFVRDIVSGEDSDIDVIQGCRADCSAISWLEGHIGFFYTQYYYEVTDPISNEIKYELGKPRIYFHRMRTSQLEDLLIYEDNSEENKIPAHSSDKSKDANHIIQSSDIHLEPKKVFVPIVTPDGHYLLIEEYNRQISSSTPIIQQSLSDELGSPCPGNRVYYRKLSVFDGKRLETLGPALTLIDSIDYRFEYIVNIQEKFWFRTNYLAPGFRVVQIFMQGSDSNWPYDINIDPGNLNNNNSNSSSSSSRSNANSNNNNNSSSSGNHSHSPYASPTNTSSTSNSRSLAKKKDKFTLAREAAASAEERRKKAWSSGIEYIPEHREGGILIRSFISSKTVMLLQYLIRGCHEIMIFDLTQTLGVNTFAPFTHPIASLPHPQFGAITAVHTNYHTNSIFYEFSNLCDPCSVYRAVVRRSPSSGFVELSFDQLCRASISGIDLYKYEIIQELVTDISETCQIPIFIFGHQNNISNRDKDRDRDIRGNGDGNDTSNLRIPRPCIVFAYGGYGISCMPIFSLSFLLFVKSFDGLICIVNTQGGGECGRVWHARGNLKYKHRPVDDIVAVSEYLIDKKFTTADQLALFSGSHGGMIISRAATRRPDLFSTVVIEDGIFDLFSRPKHDPSIFGDSSDNNNGNSSNHGSRGNLATSAYKTSTTPLFPSHNHSTNSSGKDSINNEIGAGIEVDNRGLFHHHYHNLDIETDSSWIDEIGDVYQPNLTHMDEEFQRILKLSPLHNVEELFRQDVYTITAEDPTLALSMASSINKVKYPKQSVIEIRSRVPSHERIIMSANPILPDESFGLTDHSSDSHSHPYSEHDHSHERNYDHTPNHRGSSNNSNNNSSSIHSQQLNDTKTVGKLLPKKSPPAILLCTATDSQVHPSHTYKLITELQRIATNSNIKDPPFVARIETEDDRLDVSYHEMVGSKYCDILGFIAVHTNAIATED